MKLFKGLSETRNWYGRSLLDCGCMSVLSFNEKHCSTYNIELGLAVVRHGKSEGFLQTTGRILQRQESLVGSFSFSSILRCQGNLQCSRCGKLDDIGASGGCCESGRNAWSVWHDSGRSMGIGAHVCLTASEPFCATLSVPSSKDHWLAAEANEDSAKATMPEMCDNFIVGCGRQWLRIRSWLQSSLRYVFKDGSALQLPNSDNNSPFFT